MSMKHMVRTLGLALVAVLAVGALSVATASAALPEFKATSFPVTFTAVNEEVPKLHSSVLGEKNIECKTSSSAGEVQNSKEVGKITVTYKECKEEGTSNACTTSGHSSGEIATNVLKGRIGYVLPKSGKITGVELEPASGTVFAAFTCTGAANNVTVEGCTIGEATPLNVISTEGHLTFAESSKKQLYTEIEGGVHKPCEQTVTASIFKVKGPGWITDKEKETFAASIELKA